MVYLGYFRYTVFVYLRIRYPALVYLACRAKRSEIRVLENPLVVWMCVTNHIPIPLVLAGIANQYVLPVLLHNLSDHLCLAEFTATVRKLLFRNLPSRGFRHQSVGQYVLVTQADYSESLRGIRWVFNFYESPPDQQAVNNGSAISSKFGGPN